MATEGFKQFLLDNLQSDLNYLSTIEAEKIDNSSYTVFKQEPAESGTTKITLETKIIFEEK